MLAELYAGGDEAVMARLKAKVHPTPYTLHPAPYTLHPTPYTLHPTPFTQRGLISLE